MKTEKIIGLLLIIGAILLFVPYTILTQIFDYPNILREDAGVILTRFNAGGSSLIIVWWLFAIVGLPILEAYVLIGQKLEGKLNYIRWATTIGIISGIAQIIGLLRWVFVVPVISDTYVHSQNEQVTEMCKIVFHAVHQYGGVVLGEHIGQLFTIMWTMMISSAIYKLKLMPKWVSVFGYLSAFIYLLGQAELFATVIPGFPFWDLAAMLGSILWLVWLIIIGIKFLKVDIT